VDAQGFVTVAALGAGAIALWLDARLEPLTPRTVGWTFIHTAGAILALKLMPQLILIVVAGSESPLRKIAALLVVLLPALVYSWLAAIWLLKLLQRAAHLR